ncbi:something about silencing protein 10 isoform X2 [Narcine bancroftii]
MLADGIEQYNLSEDSLDEEEVMPLELPDSDEEADEDEGEEGEEDEDEEEIDMDSDLESKSDDDLPSALAWGQKKKSYYDTDYDDDLPRGKKKVEALEQAEEEEEEAINIQKRLAEDLSEDDFGLDLIQTFAKEQEVEALTGKDLKITKDLNKMTRKEKMKLLKKESPELLELIEDFKAKLVELRDELQPLMEMIRNRRIPAEKDAQYVQTKYHLYLNYCTNISFYLVLKAKRIPVQNHPVIERLLTYRNLINDLHVVDMKRLSDIQQHLSRTGKDKRVSILKKNLSQLRKQSKTEQKAKGKLTGDMLKDLKNDAGVKAGFPYHEQMKSILSQKRKGTQEASTETAAVPQGILGADEKRKITYQIAKNKGLTPRRKKIDRNPRVKHREKFRRAKIRRKGQVREVRREEQRYCGELSGIRAGVKKSIKLH